MGCTVQGRWYYASQANDERVHAALLSAHGSTCGAAGANGCATVALPWPRHWLQVDRGHPDMKFRAHRYKKGAVRTNVKPSRLACLRL
jgi:hypothetical protein